MIEVEIKLPLRQRDNAGKETVRIASALCGMGFRKAARFRQRDSYFDNAAGEIRAGGKALRIRETEDLLQGRVTAELNFKGPRMDQVSMTRQELEILVPEPEGVTAALRRLEALLGELGYQMSDTVTRSYLSMLQKH